MFSGVRDITTLWVILSLHPVVLRNCLNCSYDVFCVHRWFYSGTSLLRVAKAWSESATDCMRRVEVAVQGAWPSCQCGEEGIFHLLWNWQDGHASSTTISIRSTFILTKRRMTPNWLDKARLLTGGTDR